MSLSGWRAIGALIGGFVASAVAGGGVGFSLAEQALPSYRRYPRFRKLSLLSGLVAFVVVSPPIAALAIKAGDSGRFKANIPLGLCSSPPIFGGYLIHHGDCNALTHVSNCYPVAGQCTCFGTVLSADQPECEDDDFGTGPDAPIWQSQN